MSGQTRMGAGFWKRTPDFRARRDLRVVGQLENLGELDTRCHGLDSEDLEKLNTVQHMQYREIC